MHTREEEKKQTYFFTKLSLTLLYEMMTFFPTWQLDYYRNFQKCAGWMIISFWKASGPYAN